MGISQESGTARGGRDCSNTIRSSPSFKFECKRKRKFVEGGTTETVEAYVPFSSSNENNSDEGAGWTDIKRAELTGEGGTSATLERAVPPSNSNANKNENAE